MEDIKTKILNAITEAREDGVTLICDDWGSKDENCACALSCFLIKSGSDVSMSTENDHEKNVKNASELLGVSTDWVESFIRGFDGDIDKSLVYCQDAYQLGADIANETQPLIYSDYIDSIFPF